MKAKETPFLDFYQVHAKSGWIGNGLCYSIGYGLSKTLNIFTPDEDEQTALLQEGFCSTYWASGLPANTKGEAYEFTPLRQTIVLLCAAINNEL